MFMAGSAWDDALRAVLPSVLVRLMMLSIMVGMTRRTVIITGQEVAALVVENGRCMCRAGFAGDAVDATMLCSLRLAAGPISSTCDVMGHFASFLRHFSHSVQEDVSAGCKGRV